MSKKQETVKVETSKEIILTPEIEKALIERATKNMAVSVCNDLTQAVNQYSMMANVGEEKYKLVPVFIISHIIQKLTNFVQNSEDNKNDKTKNT